MHAAAVTGALPWADHRLTVEDLASLLRRPAWQADGACHEHPEISWFVERGRSAEPARRVCATCLVRPQCASWAAAQGVELQGVWGGLTRQDRLAGITTPRPVAEAQQPRCQRCGAEGEDLTGKLCAACHERAGRQREDDKGLFPEKARPVVKARPAPGSCVKCGRAIEAGAVRRVEGHPLHGSTCYYQARREAAKLGTTIEAIVEQLARREEPSAAQLVPIRSPL